MQYRFTKDFGRFKKGQILSDDKTTDWVIDLNDFQDAMMLHTGILEEVKEEKKDKWYITGRGAVFNQPSAKVQSRISFLGGYDTKEEAEKARDDVREFIRNRNK